MKIAYFVNSFKSINWGGQATSSGIKKLVENTYADAEFIPLSLPPFPLNKVRVFRRFWEKKLAEAILQDDRVKVLKNLKKLNIDEEVFDSFDTVCFNGEGAIHKKSRHLIRLMGMLYECKKRGAFVSALNQTVDLGDDERLQKVVQKVYSMVDYLAVREPVSQRELQKLGLKPELVADAAYALGNFSKDKIEELTKEMHLPEKFIAVTGSSYLKRNKKSMKLMSKVLNKIQNHYEGIPIYFLANAKTDIYLAKKLQAKYGYTIVASPIVKHDKAMAVIARSYLVVGGRQHPNIFAAMHGTPFIPFKGNTHKMEGVVELLEYPLNVLKWDDEENIVRAFEKMESLRKRLNDMIVVPKIESICLDTTQKKDLCE